MPSQGSVAQAANFRERLLPGPGWWLVVSALVAMIAIAYGAALGFDIGVVVGVGLGLIAVVALVRGSPRIEVSNDTIRCGRAVMPRNLVSDVRHVQGSDLTSIRRGLDPLTGDRVFLVVPPWLSKTAVVLTVNDSTDPHAAWLIASRRPEALAAALSTPIAGR